MDIASIDLNLLVALDVLLRERNVTRIADSITAGAYLDGVGRRVLLGESLARRLEVEVGDKVVIAVQDLGG